MIKKVLTYSVVVTTLVWSIGLLATPLAVSAVTPVSGDLFKIACPAGADSQNVCRAVYYLGADGKRYVFPNEKTYKTWYSDFSGIKEVSSTEMATYPLGGNVTFKPGVRLVKVQTVPSVYTVSAGGVLHKIPSEAVAAELYGTAWATMVSDIPDAFWFSYTPGSDITVASDYDKAMEVANATSINVDKGLTGGGTPGGPVSTGTSLKVERAADTPASGIILQNTARNPFTKINLTASADGDIIIDALTVTRTGLGQDGAFASLDILDAATGMPLNKISKTLNSDHNAVFGDDITVKAGTTLTIIIAANMNLYGGNNAGEAPILSLSAITLKGGAVVGTLPINGNYQTLNGTIAVGGAKLYLGAYSNATQGALEVGYPQYAFMSLKVENSSNVEDEQISSLTVYQKGSASLDTDLDNIKLYKDGTEIATGSLQGSDKVYFTFSPISIPKGQSVQLVVKADVAGGSGRTVQLGIYDYADAMVKGLVYNANILPTLGSAVDNVNYFASQPFFVDNQATISRGTMTVGQSTAVPTGNIAILPDQKIGAFLFTIKGEPVNVTKLVLKINSTSAANTDVVAKSIRVVDKDGNSVAGPGDIAAGTMSVTLTDSFTMPVGDVTYYVVANIPSNAGIVTNDKIWVSINNPSTDITGKGDVTNLSIAPTLTSAVAGYQQTIKAANLTVTRYAIPTNGTAIVKSTNVLIGSWHFDATNSGEDIRLTSLKLKTSSTAAVKQLALMDGTTLLANKQDITTATTLGNPSTTTFALYTPLVIPKGQAKDVKLYGNIDTTGVAGQIIAFGITDPAEVTASGVTTGNNAAVTVVASEGAQITFTAAAALSIEKQGSNTVLRTVGGTTALKLGEWLLKSTNEALDITQLRLNTVDASTDATCAGTYTGDNTMLSTMYLKLDGNIIGNAGGYNSVAGDGLLVPLNTNVLRIPYDTVGKTLGLYGDVTPMGPGANVNYNAAFKVGFWGVDSFIATGVESGQAATITIGNAGADATTTPYIVNKAMPIVTQEAFATGEKASSGILGRIKITASGGAVGLYRMTFVTQTTRSQIDLTNGALWLLSCTNGSCNIGAGQQLSATQAAGVELAPTQRWDFVVANGPTHGMKYLNIPSGASAVVEFRAVVTGSGNPTTGNVLTSLLGDLATSTQAKTATDNGNTQGNTAAAYAAFDKGNLVWTDFSNPTSGTGSAETLPQWYNGYGLTSAAYTPLAATSSSQNLAY